MERRCQVPPLNVDDFEGIDNLLGRMTFLFVVVGPELPACFGNQATTSSAKVFGPTKAGAAIEASWQKL